MICQFQVLVWHFLDGRRSSPVTVSECVKSLDEFVRNRRSSRLVTRKSYSMWLVFLVIVRLRSPGEIAYVDI